MSPGKAEPSRTAGTVGAGGSSLGRRGSPISSQFQSLPARQAAKPRRDSRRIVEFATFFTPSEPSRGAGSGAAERS
jgi:hypothetical protein